MLKLLKRVILSLLISTLLSFGNEVNEFVVKFEWRVVDFCGCVYHMSGECQNYNAYKALYSVAIDFVNSPVCFDWFPFKIKLQVKVPLCRLRMECTECTNEDTSIKVIEVKQVKRDQPAILLWLEY